MGEIGDRDSFWLSELVANSGLIYTSSDLSNVTVKRKVSVSGEIKTMTFNLLDEAAEKMPDLGHRVRSGHVHMQPGRRRQVSERKNSLEVNPKADLWLRDGDVIGIPEMMN